MSESILIYRYYLAINFGMPNDINFLIKYKNKDAYIIFKNIESTSYHPYKGNSIDWDQGDSRIFDLSIPNSDETQNIFQSHFLNKDDVFKYGFKKYNSSNIVSIRFSKSIPENEREEFAEGCLKRFIDIYRLATFYGFGDSSFNNKIPAYQILEGELFSEGKFRQDTHKYGFTTELPSGESFNSYKIDQSTLVSINQRLAIDKDLETFEKLLCEGKKLYTYQRDYSLSIVVFGTAFEVYVQKKLIDLCIAKGIETLKKRNQDVPFSEVIMESNIGVLLKKYLVELTSIEKIEEQEVYNNWHSKAYSKRNRIIHRGENDINEEDAKKAYLAIADFSHFIKEL